MPKTLHSSHDPRLSFKEPQMSPALECFLSAGYRVVEMCHVTLKAALHGW